METRRRGSGGGVSTPTSPAAASSEADYYRRQLETVADNATLALFIMDEHQRCTYMNPAAERLTGFTLDEVRGQALHYYVHHTRPDGSHYPLEECPIDQAFPQNMREQGEEVFVHKDGHFYTVEFTASPILEDGEPVGTIIEVRDITEEKRAEAERRSLGEQLEHERTRLATIFELAPAFIATLRGPDHVFEMANPPFLNLFGGRDLIGKPVAEALPEIEAQGFIDLLDTVYRTGEAYVGAEVLAKVQRKPDGPLEAGYFNFVYQPLSEADGAVTGILVHAVDVTTLVEARKRAEEQSLELEAQAEQLETQAGQLEEIQVELEATNEELQAANRELVLRADLTDAARREAENAWAVLDGFFRAAPVAAALVDSNLRYRRMNDMLAALDGVDPEGVIGRSVFEVVPELAPRLEPVYRQVLEKGESVAGLQISGPHPSRPGDKGHFIVNYFPVRLEGDEAGVGVVAVDVTDRMEAEEARKEDTRIVETLHQVGRSLASELDQQRVVQEVTDAATSLTGAQFGAFFYNVVGEGGEAYTLYTISGVPREEFSKFPQPRNTPVFEPTFHGTGVVRSDDITKDPRYGQMAPHHGMPRGHLPVRSYLAVPVISRAGDVLGGLFFGHAEAGVFQERHERLAVGIAGWAAVAMDNARLYQAEQRARAEAESANRAKSDFLTTMSHELRTPLNAMIGYSDLLLAGVPDPITEGAQQKVERIAISARHLLELIEEILTFSRLEAGRETVDAGDVDPGAIVTEVQALMEPLAMAKGLDLRVHAPARPRVIESDARKVRQILLNLLGNAVKFSETGRVDLHLEEVGDTVLFRVTDSGRGIAPEHLESVFEPFWQAESGTTRKAEGTGLGLSVSRRLARLLGGDVTVTSEPGAGSTFTLSVPAHPPRPTPAD